MTDAPVLEMRDVTVSINGNPVVDHLSLHVDPGETLALVGESGCGKSLTALSVLNLLPDVATRSAGAINLQGSRIDTLSQRQMDAVRGSRIGMIFQEPVASLDPLMRIGRQITEALRLSGPVSSTEAEKRAIAMLDRVGIREPALRVTQYPFELSGGMCQRVMIAIAMIRQPALLIADEPTTALDVTIQAQILELMADLRRDLGTAVLLITHDMGVVAEIADRIAVMYAGRIVETGPVNEVLGTPAHPYTALLLRTVPRIDGPRKKMLPAIEGIVPEATDWPEGCRFRDRCPLATEICAEMPPLAAKGRESHRAACWHSDRVAEVA
ncbi:ABC transporter ATP-binding protein [Oceaniovalibus sp. ACAM 378]|uniref:ABC transporter ATP-binding protein n=1 Tax=Oceaniovalibus sp. ACAM 378 TaxID=2599923 RepID=UPI0011D42CF1|nr:ABC transporter ATP-binding protein [Oceaniovalibus sp. ACAM 378]TYB89058.1 ABC transporter ATP-binding protein [Oceaniovalibus sp. ACAM 378]